MLQFLLLISFLFAYSLLNNSILWKRAERLSISWSTKVIYTPLSMMITTNLRMDEASLPNSGSSFVSVFVQCVEVHWSKTRA